MPTAAHFLLMVFCQPKRCRPRDKRSYRNQSGQDAHLIHLTMYATDYAKLSSRTRGQAQEATGRHDTDYGPVGLTLPKQDS